MKKKIINKRNVILRKGKREMKLKGIKNLQITAIVLQFLTVIMIIGLTACQSAIKPIFTSERSLIEYHSIPYQSLIQAIPMLVLYVVALFVINKTSSQFTKVKSIVLIIIACVLKVLLGYTFFINAIVALQGTIALASYSTLESAIGMLTGPLTLVAFALYCVSLGGYVGLENR